jgi:hypothetical protein
MIVTTSASWGRTMLKAPLPPFNIRNARGLSRWNRLLTRKMDHLMLPKEPALDPIEVPPLSLEAYDGGDLTTYPEREG